MPHTDSPGLTGGHAPTRRRQTQVSAVGPDSEVHDLGTHRGEAGGFWSTPAERRLTVVVLPGEADQVTDARRTSEMVHSAYLPEVGLTVAAMQPATAASGPDAMLWQEPGGQLRNSHGRVVPSAALSVSDAVSTRAIVVFRDDDLGVWGFIDAPTTSGWSSQWRACPWSRCS
ncbi:MAG TPA: hypothetical protein PLB21_12635 [Actinomycetota bacterium]|jgi:hypothetical protein|nr:hypothetical protein [Actinomycetota bacterium]